MKTYCKHVIAAFIGLSGIATSSNAATQENTFAARGLGSQTCQLLVSSLEGRSRELASQQITAWISGYLSHANRVTPNTYDVSPIVDITDLGTIVARLCDQNPELTIEPVLSRVLDILRPASLTNSSDIVTLQNDLGNVQIRQEVLMKVQDALIQDGVLEAGSADGVYGPRTATAISNFQQKIGLPVTGLPDAVTIFVLIDTVN